MLIHHKADRAPQRLDTLRAAGFDAEWLGVTGMEQLRRLREHAADAVVIDLDHLPSHGRAVGVALRQRKSTRNILLIFAGGAPEKVARLKEALPDATYTEWDHAAEAIRAAMLHRPSGVFVPKNISGYSGTPLPKKLGIKPGATVALLGAPPRFDRLLEPLPEGARLRDNVRGGADLILLFAPRRAEMELRFPRADRGLNGNSGLWIIWPKKASGVQTDLSEPAVRAFGIENGFVDYKVCAVDATWSGLLFARKK